MQAYEFYATPENGSIKIPEKYRDKITSGVKVILLEEKLIGKEVNNHYKSSLLLTPTLNTKDWEFSRDEANER